ncbi:MAG: CxxxxCH/CxxCH domain-containing protein [Chloroflexi bacterium]|nr:CxxxxCH/CxxCH domain-containing protein [Chloroflexota bacterium]
MKRFGNTLTPSVSINSPRWKDNLTFTCGSCHAAGKSQRRG